MSSPVDKDIGAARLEAAEPLDSRRFELAVRRLADSLGAGTWRSPFKGPGIDYVQSRRYQAGDPVKVIDWKVTARTGHTYVKDYELPKRMPVYLVIDSSASMAVASRPPSKYALAVQLAGGLARLAQDCLSPVALVGAGSRRLRSRPTLAHGQVYAWLHSLRSYRFDERTELDRRLDELGASLSERSLVLVLSDLQCAGAKRALERLRQRHDCAVVRLVDPAETGVAGGGFIRGREAESGRRVVAPASRRWFDPESELVALRRSGIDAISIVTGEPFIPQLRRFLEDRHLIVGGAG